MTHHARYDIFDPEDHDDRWTGADHDCYSRESSDPGEHANCERYYDGEVLVEIHNCGDSPLEVSA